MIGILGQYSMRKPKHLPWLNTRQLMLQYTMEQKNCTRKKTKMLRISNQTNACSCMLLEQRTSQ